MKRSTLLPALAVLGAVLASMPALFQPQDNNGIADAQTTPRTFAAIGSISNVQSEDGNPAWILSGGWKMRASLSPDDNSTASFVASTRMVRTDGTAMHMHKIYDFELKDWTSDSSTMSFNGTATVTLRDGPTEDVPVAITIMNGGAVSIEIDDSVVDHFGGDPMYGVVVRTFDSSPGIGSSDHPMDETMHGTKPTNATAANMTGLTRSDVEYYPNATGYLVHPENGTSLPAVVMIHEWWGLNQNIKNEAEKLAKEGYVVLAVDLYGGRVATEPSAAMAYVTEVRNNSAAATENLQAAVSHLSGLPNVNSSRIASLGWCFGGGQSLQLALNTEQPLAATVIYYGNLVTDEEALSVIDWPLLGIFGATDQSIPVQTVRDFEAALDSNEIPNEIHIYEGVGHAFANPSGDNYAPAETADAWAKTLEFLESNV